jgi:hypothetical protein
LHLYPKLEQDDTDMAVRIKVEILSSSTPRFQFHTLPTIHPTRFQWRFGTGVCGGAVAV